MRCVLASVLVLVLPSSHPSPPSLPAIRIPAEWAPQEAVWMQWPKNIESSYRENCAGIIDVLHEHEEIRILVEGPGAITSKGVKMAANYLNWLVVNEAAILCGFGNPTWDAAAAATVAVSFPGRTIELAETLELWYWGGGVNCVTNDQPAAPGS